MPILVGTSMRHQGIEIILYAPSKCANKKLLFDLKLIDPRFAHYDHSEPFGDIKKRQNTPKDQTKFKRYFKFVDRW